MNQRLNKKICIFDFDGTLVDSMEALADIAGLLMSHHYGLTFEEARRKYVQTSGDPFRVQLEKLFPQDLRNEGVAEQFEKTKRERYLEKNYHWDVVDTLKYLKARGVRLVVSSSNDQELVERFVQEKNDAEFDLVLGWRPGFTKGRVHFQQVQKIFQVPSRDILFIGDSLRDFEEARTEGIDFVGKTGLFSTADFQSLSPQVTLINSLTELREIL